MLEKINLKNYKQFKDVTISGLGRINLIAGKNSTGKTSILEAIFLAHDRGSPELYLKLLSWRGLSTINITPEMLWSHIFNNMNISEPIEIKLTNNDSTELIKIECKTVNSADFNSSLSKSSNNIQLNQSNNRPIESLYTEYSKSNISKGSTELIIAQQNMQLKVNNLSPMERSVTFVGSSNKGYGLIDCERYGQLDVESKTSEVIDVLKTLDPRIKGMSIVPHGETPVLYVDIGLPRKVPIHLMGEGFIRLASIVITMFFSKNSIICIDEIENGFHYSVFETIWPTLYKICEQTKCQVIMTTHSSDCVESLGDYVTKNSGKKISLTRLDKENGEIVAKCYSASMLAAAYEGNWELR